MNKKRNAPERLAYRNGGKKQITIKYYKRIFRNAILKGTAVGALLIWFLGMMAFDADIKGGLFVAILAEAYIALFVLANRNVIGGGYVDERSSR